MGKWYKTKYPGVRYREHPTRKHGVQSDKYFAIRYSLNGKQREEALGWATAGWSAQEASEELSRIKKAQRVGGEVQTLAEGRNLENCRREAEEQRKKQEAIEAVTFGRFFEDTYIPLVENHKTEQVIKTDKSYFKIWLMPIIGDKSLKQIVPMDLERVKKNMNDAGKAPKTIEHALAIVRMVFNTAIDIGKYTGENPTKRVKKPKVDNRRLRFLSYAEAGELLEALMHKSTNLHDMSVIALDCAPRAGEIFGLDWRDISIERGIITFRNTKNGIVRHIPMTDRVKEIFRARKIAAKSEIVFPARLGRRRKEVSNAFAAVVEDLGWNEGIEDRRQKVTFHTLRHTCASWLVMAGVPLFTVKEYLGHQQISQTERYSHLSPENLQQAVAVLNDLQPEDETAAGTQEMEKSA